MSRGDPAQKPLLNPAIKDRVRRYGHLAGRTCSVAGRALATRPGRLQRLFTAYSRDEIVQRDVAISEDEGNSARLDDATYQGIAVHEGPL